jgi:hypothetical protein
MKVVTRTETNEVIKNDGRLSFSEVRKFILEKTKYPEGKSTVPEEFTKVMANIEFDSNRTVIPVKVHNQNVILRLPMKGSLINIRAGKAMFGDEFPVVVAIGENVVNVKVGDKVMLMRSLEEFAAQKRFLDIKGNARHIERVKEKLDMLSPEEGNQLTKEGIVEAEVTGYIFANAVVDIAYTSLI